MIETYGENGKEIICPEDYTIIYKIHNDKDEIICPTCNLVFYNCIFCNKTLKNKINNCCIKAHIKFKNKEIFNYFFTNIKIDESTEVGTHFCVITSFIPFISPFYLILTIMVSIEKYTDMCVLISEIVISLIFSIIYGILHYIIFISFFILSIPFKLYPFKIFLALLLAK